MAAPSDRGLTGSKHPSPPEHWAPGTTLVSEMSLVAESPPPKESWNVLGRQTGPDCGSDFQNRRGPCLGWERVCGLSILHLDGKGPRTKGDAELLDWLVLKSFLREQTSALGANVR